MNELFSQNEMAHLLDNLHDAVIAFSSDWRIIYFNHAAETMYGYQAAEVLGRYSLEVLKPVYIGITRDEAIQQLATSGKADTIAIHEAKDGRKLVIESRIRLLCDSQGASKCAVAIYRDITAQYRLKAALRKRRTQFRLDLTRAKVLQNIGAEPLANDWQTLYEKLVDAAVQIMHADFASLQMLYPERGPAGELHLLAYRGFTPQAALLWEWVAPGISSTCGIALRKRKRIVVPNLEKYAPLRDTENLSRLLQAGIRAGQSTPLLSRSGKIVGMMSTHWRQPHDPTERDLRFFDLLARQAADLIERKRTEDELRRSEQHHKELAEALRLADQQKNSFLATLSHELRNPLAAIRSSVALLKQTRAGNEHVQRASDIIDRQSFQLCRLVDDLLDVSRITQNKIKLQREVLDLNELIQKLWEDHQLVTNQTELSFQLDLAPGALLVNGDRTRLAQIFWNLIQNGIKFTPSGGSIRVSTRLDAENKCVVVHVTDTGIGIPPEAMKRLFHPFVQLENNPVRCDGGLGLGLALVKGIVDLHGGKLDVFSAGQGTGADFSVTLPLYVETNRETTVSAPVPCRPRRILIIEDNPDLADSLKELLEINHHTVAIACDGAEGLAKTQKLKPDIVLCDIGLPKMDGFAVIKAIRADENLSHIFVVALTGYAQKDDINEVLAAGFDKHIAKPADFHVLQQIINAAEVRLAS